MKAQWEAAAAARGRPTVAAATRSEAAAVQYRNGIGAERQRPVAEQHRPVAKRRRPLADQLRSVGERQMIVTERRRPFEQQ